MAGHVDPWWDDSFKTLEYNRSPKLPHEELEKRWIEEGYDRVILNGGRYVSMNHLPDYDSRFCEIFDLENIGITFFEMRSLEVLPLHFDPYPRYIKMHNVKDPKSIWRVVIFLEDWKSGHYLEVDGKAYVNWQAGDWVAWNWDTLHYAANIGLEPRYTVQLTGTKTK